MSNGKLKAIGTSLHLKVKLQLSFAVDHDQPCFCFDSLPNFSITEVIKYENLLAYVLCFQHKFGLGYLLKCVKASAGCTGAQLLQFVKGKVLFYGVEQ